ncbi:hypothetical protein [Aneurinibacillus tyrosinisolvens]|uniref:hypothetical protein n=1 Tax=Aneurinibacillus tyrosinisolvens TaxID=1443435 RepID=UPI00069CBBBF|nr:hypothetical protein [Aneurinibacillus tyrosinisolvens]
MVIETLFISSVIGILLVFLFRKHIPHFHRSQGKWAGGDGIIFTNAWVCGAAVFLYNVALFGLVALLFFGNILLASKTHLSIPIFIYAPFAVAASILGWMWFGKNWSGSFKERMQIAATGSGFYWLLAAFAVYRLLTLEPQFPGDDTFMAAVGLFMLLVITGGAAVLCMATIFWTGRKNA